ncbi:flagellar protein [[Clostridium] polysaccharolyticum]|uniref:Flagellar operon protein TIGR03826 n=1 Tax=[Clostridium] polysaccharolyticum TaxID=29364 RepID=A0A1I0FYY9_9FIRM|nr:flagellar protein [[Clostridium] polysaccharolyticum]SET62903.1 hypothetical protein SAMN04487772_14011 [[Clostridium] polysaccharolyticum]
MEVRNCRDCGKLFNYIGSVPLCPACMKKLDEKYAKVKEYIYDNPGATINEVSEANEVSVNQIKKWVREEKLSFTEDSPVGIPCEGCGKQIKTGRFCKECKIRVANEIESFREKPQIVGVKKEKKDSAKMRFLQ